MRRKKATDATANAKGLDKAWEPSFRPFRTLPFEACGRELSDLGTECLLVLVSRCFAATWPVTDPQHNTRIHQGFLGEAGEAYMFYRIFSPRITS